MIISDGKSIKNFFPLIHKMVNCFFGALCPQGHHGLSVLAALPAAGFARQCVGFLTSASAFLQKPCCRLPRAATSIPGAYVRFVLVFFHYFRRMLSLVPALCKLCVTEKVPADVGRLIWILSQRMLEPFVVCFL